MSMPARSAHTADGESGIDAITTFSPAFWRCARSGTLSFLRSSGTECGLVGTFVERLHLTSDGVGMRCERALVEVGPRARLMIEMAVAVHSAHQRRRVADLDLSHMRRDVADGKADAAIVRTVRLRAVHQLDVVQ